MINILFCSDDKYAPKLAAAMGSLLAANKAVRRQLNIIIRTNDMSDMAVSELWNIAKRSGLERTQFHVFYTEELCRQLEKEQVKKFKGSYLCYFKLFGLEKLVAETEERLLVIDCDTLICGSIWELYHFNLDEKAAAAVWEFPSRHTCHGKNGLGEYNTGVILYDMKKYKSLDIQRRLKEAVWTIPQEEWHTGDQAVFTLGLDGNHGGLVKTLPLKYNFIMNQMFFSYEDFVYIRKVKNKYYSRQEYELARKHPCIVHLISGEFLTAPWYYEGERSIKKIWDGYLKGTWWEKHPDKVYEHLSVKQIITGCVCRMVYWCLPGKISRRIFRKAYWNGK